MKLLVVRHGQTQANAEQRYLGAFDLPLNELGVLQAKDIARTLSSDINALYCSPLLRARQTSALISETLGIPSRIAPAFRERNVGVFEGLTQLEAATQFPLLWARNATRHWRDAPDGGESIEEVFLRVAAGLAQLRCDHGSKSILLVAHGFVAKVLRALVSNQSSDFFDWQLGNGHTLELQIPEGWTNCAANFQFNTGHSNSAT
ncbi:MAG: histidine phosphatase family protein [Comamonadaceae bacterium]|nr:histidine phosphatase family protein [Comamonadaceae bacterium]